MCINNKINYERNFAHAVDEILMLPWPTSNQRCLSLGNRAGAVMRGFLLVTSTKRFRSTRQRKWIPSVRRCPMPRFLISLWLRALHLTISCATFKVGHFLLLLFLVKTMLIRRIFNYAGTKGQPSFAKLFRYPQLVNSAVVANKSFFLGDRVEMKWNKMGNCVLLMTTTDVDSSGASYYGKQALHFLDTKGNSAMVQLREFFTMLNTLLTYFDANYPLLFCS